ncbi:saccharopine dehydrogenase family protein [Sciscionella sediminilitoris]|uniref:saccharopine dehydrogenase family protein n=1 Tax=Sciscionella sediminilitoris TaxID=1445613 RepID=UPI0004DF995B|nr:saccharopine dehydrogenase NADP-binding domain-containing protein [Sciscionella sp. SE31]
MSVLIYGATGHTGQLVARRAVRDGLRPILAGRSAPKVVELAGELGLDYRVADLADPKGLRAALEDVEVVAHCAGPFSATWRPMVDACLETRTHYIDITGEIDVFEAIYARSAEAEAAGVVLLPGGGFDVVPTDCLAAMVHEAMPEAVELDIAFAAQMSIGPGTVKTAVEGAGTGGRARVDGAVRSVPMAHKQITALFPAGPKTVSAIPWGDVASAYRTTGIPNITTYTIVPGARLLSTGQRYFGPVLRSAPVQKAGKALIDRFFRPETEVTGGRSQAWACARDAEGTSVSASLTGPGPLPLTADAVLRIADRLAAGEVRPGSHTPATAFGAGFVAELDEVRVERP